VSERENLKLFILTQIEKARGEGKDQAYRDICNFFKNYLTPKS